MSEKSEQRGSSQFPVPNGFRNLLEALAREVLRSQPTDIYAFSSIYLQHLVKFRDEYHVNPIDDKDLYDHFKTAFFKEVCSLNLVQSAMLNSIFGAKNQPNISGGSGGFGPGDKVQPKDDSSHGSGEEKIMHISKLTHPEEKTAEVGAKGSHDSMAASLKQQHPAPSLSTAVADNSSANHPLASPDEAAALIQAGVRGFLTRKHLEEEGVHISRPKSPNLTNSSHSNHKTDGPNGQQPAAFTDKIGAIGNHHIASEKLSANVGQQPATE
ncbi:unnamed protein product [Soboliphyme baturini]|uniref:RIIa domain-containing protein n=1 Tax=Soboliphyme baturini TaxID=241478 RepID=A0A183IN56_9BILA|nr:unnamed protein product [Soboliphyme baturini]